MLVLNLARQFSVSSSARASTAALQRFDEEAGHLGLHVSWAQIKIQNVSHGAALPALSVDANTVDSASDFIYLCSKITCDRHRNGHLRQCSTLYSRRRLRIIKNHLAPTHLSKQPLTTHHHSTHPPPSPPPPPSTRVFKWSLPFQQVSHPWTCG